jgi:hypothetical protein
VNYLIRARALISWRNSLVDIDGDAGPDLERDRQSEGDAPREASCLP